MRARAVSPPTERKAHFVSHYLNNSRFLGFSFESFRYVAVAIEIQPGRTSSEHDRPHQGPSVRKWQTLTATPLGANALGQFLHISSVAETSNKLRARTVRALDQLEANGPSRLLMQEATALLGEVYARRKTSQLLRGLDVAGRIASYDNETKRALKSVLNEFVLEPAFDIANKPVDEKQVKVAFDQIKDGKSSTLVDFSLELIEGEEREAAAMEARSVSDEADSPVVRRKTSSLLTASTDGAASDSDNPFSNRNAIKNNKP
jgi:hypothetical protein